MCQRRMSLYAREWETGDGGHLYHSIVNGLTVKTDEPWFSLSNKSQDALIQMRILSEVSPEEERDACLAELHSLQNGADPIGVLVVTNYDCNLHCPYCYQDRDDVRQEAKYPVKAAAIADWIIHATKAHDLNLSFMGGEALLNLPFLLDVTALVAKERPVNAKLVTNGVLLTSQVVQRLLDASICSAMISIDGPKEKHDARRGETYSIILQNVERAVSLGMHIQLNVKIDRDNALSIPMLLDDLGKRGFEKEVELCFGFIQNTQKQHRHCLQHAFCDEEAGKAYRKMWQAFGKMHIPYADAIGIGTCPRQRLGCITVDYLGDLYKCNSMIGDRRNRSGTIMRNSTLESLICKTHIPEECGKCTYLPICHGGCWNQKRQGAQACQEKFFHQYTSVPYDQYIIRNAGAR